MASLALAAFCSSSAWATQAGEARAITSGMVRPNYSFPLHIDQDGRLDLVVISRSAGESMVWRNRVDEPFEPVQKLDTRLGTTDVMTMDLDEDGADDIVVNRELSGTMQWFRALGGGAFGARSVLLAPEGSLFDPAVGDIDGDGRDDIVVGRPTGVSWFRNLGNATFAPEIAISALTDGESESLVLEDFDADGDLDVVAALSGAQIGYYQNVGAGSFAAGVALGSGPAGDVTLEAADVDGNGVVDVLIGWAGSESIGLLANQGSALFVPEITIVSNVGGPPNMVARDLNQDGLLDLLIATGSSSIRYSIQHSGVMFDPATQPDIYNFDGAGSRINDADLDGDGFTDIQTMRSDWVSSYSGDPGSFALFEIVPEILFDNLRGTDGVLSTDADQDGDLDLLIASGDRTVVRYFENTGDGSFQASRNAMSPFVRPVVHDTSDVSGDGIPDLLITSTSGARQLSLAEGVGDGTFGPMTTLFTHGWEENVRARFGDVDGDGDMDVVLGDKLLRTLYWIENLGNGSLSLVAQVIYAGIDFGGQESQRRPRSSSATSMETGISTRSGHGTTSSGRGTMAPRASRRWLRSTLHSLSRLT